MATNGLVSGNPFDGIVQCGSSGVPAGCFQGIFSILRRASASLMVPTEKPLFRGGYGIFFEHTNGNEGNTESLEGSPPLIQNITVQSSHLHQHHFQQFCLRSLNVVSIPAKAIWPYVQQWNFSAQRELPNTVVTLAYAGSKGTHLTDQRDINQLLPTPGSQNPYAPGQVIGANDCSSLTVNGNPVTGGLCKI